MGRAARYAFDWVAWGLFAAVPATIFYSSATSLAEQGAASGGPMQNAALFPRLVATVMLVLLAVQGWRIATNRLARPSPLTRSDGTPLAIVTAVLFAAFLVFLPVLGFHLATPATAALLFRLYGLGLIRAILGGITLSLVIAFVFEGLLNVVLPVGRFGIAIFS